MKIMKTLVGQEIMVDDSDFEKLSLIQWYLSGGYAVTRFGGWKLSLPLYIHKLVMGVAYTKGVIVDHIDRNKLNNQKSNLRLADRHQNGYNRQSARGSSSKYLGVMKRYNGVWQAVITTKSESKSIGTFKSEVEAAMCYDMMAKLLHGEFASLNFPK